MKRFCLLLCISLLSSMFHAAAMPVETLQAPAPADVSATAHHHACDALPEASPATSLHCKLSGHLCCLGITAVTHTDVAAAIFSAELLNAVLHTLALQDHPFKQFKPPKAFFQS